MKILFLNCANRKNCEYLKNYVISNNVDIVILAESKNVRKELSKEFKYTFLSSYKFGLTVLSKIPFKVEEIKYIIDDDRLRINNDNYCERVLNINIKNLNILAAHVDYGFYNPFAMIAIEKYLNFKDVVEYSISKNMSQTMISEYKLKLIDKKLLETKLKEMKNLIDNNDK